jgi:hypothetical protein
VTRGGDFQFLQYYNVIEKVNSISPPKSVVGSRNTGVNLQLHYLYRKYSKVDTLFFTINFKEYQIMHVRNFTYYVAYQSFSLLADTPVSYCGYFGFGSRPSN